MVLVDTSIWIEHFRNCNQHLVELLQNDAVLCHPLVIAEIACGTPPSPRAQTLGDLKLLRQTELVLHDELLNFIEINALFGRGCGYVDLALLASTKLTRGAQIWTLDKRLVVLCNEFSLSYKYEQRTNRDTS